MCSASELIYFEQFFSIVFSTELSSASGLVSASRGFAFAAECIGFAAQNIIFAAANIVSVSCGTGLSYCAP